MKYFFIILIGSTIFFFIGCDKNQRIAQSYADKYAMLIKDYKIVDEFYQPTKEDIFELIKKENPKDINIENLHVKVESGQIFISVNGKEASSMYQTEIEFTKEKEKYRTLLNIGPVIKGFYLGMTKDSVVTLVNKSFPENEINKYKFSSFGAPEKSNESLFQFAFKDFMENNVGNWMFYNGNHGESIFLLFLESIDLDLIYMVAGAYSYFLFDNENKLIAFQLGKNDIKHLFQSGDMSLKDFSQNFVNSYKFINSLEPFSKYFDDKFQATAFLVTGMVPIYGTQNGYTFHSDYGWNLSIFFTSYIKFDGVEHAYDSHNSEAVAIRLIKNMSSKKAVFGD